MGDDGQEFEDAMRRLGLRPDAGATPSDDDLFEAELERLGVEGLPDEEHAREEDATAAPPSAPSHRVAEDAALFEAAVEDLGDPPAAPEEDPTRPGRRRKLTTGSHQTLRRRLKAGELAHELELDLHGLREDEARQALEAFLRRGRKEGREVVRVICGKGLHSRDRAVLHEAVPRWLRRDLREHLADAVSAPGALGGSGAWYVILRRAPE
ncbi:MAG: Smr/MutS family protein [Myxococcota bacterium]